MARQWCLITRIREVSSRAGWREGQGIQAASHAEDAEDCTGASADDFRRRFEFLSCAWRLAFVFAPMMSAEFDEMPILSSRHAERLFSVSSGYMGGHDAAYTSITAMGVWQ